MRKKGIIVAVLTLILLLFIYNDLIIDSLKSLKKEHDVVFTIISPPLSWIFNNKTYAQNLHIVTRVIDGDTIVIDGNKKIRLIGIDTPETVHSSKPVEFYGKEASKFTKQMIEGKKIRLEYDVQRTDRYRRTLAYVYLEDGTFLNAELVKQGYAKISTYPSNVKYVDLFLKLQQDARENNRGLWNKEKDI